MIDSLKFISLQYTSLFVNVYSECNICLACGVGVCIPITCLACNNGVYYIECQKHIESSPKAIPSTPAARTPPPSDISRKYGSGAQLSQNITKFQIS